MSAAEVRFGQNVLPVIDPHGLHIALVESADSLDRAFTPWEGSPVAVASQIRGLESARMVERDLVVTASFLSNAMGFTHLATENGWHRYGVADGKSGAYVDLRETPTVRRGAWGTGSIHHIAWRVDDEAHQLEVRENVSEKGARPTPVIDRFWFKSVYFPEPGGVLFELATEGPGFAVDEDRAHLGETLVLPPWLEPNRAEIMSMLPQLEMPRAAPNR
jgi:glyoxalase family protein